MNGPNKNNQFLLISITASLTLAITAYLAYRSTLPAIEQKTKEKKLDGDDVTKSKDVPSTATTTPPNKKVAPPGVPQSSPQAEGVTETPEKKTKTTTPEDVLKQVTEIDKKGKELYKKKDFLKAATAFSEALDLLSTISPSQAHRQVITITNNRSAMYEKASLNELALEDCDTILEQEKTHLKARLRKLRILESEKRWKESLVEVCALQLNFMRENRDKIRMGLPIPQPPISQSKVEELMEHILPDEVDNQYEMLQLSSSKPRPLPTKHTINQLLKSFNGYNAWMAQAAKNGPVNTLTKQMEELKEDDEDFTAKKAVLLLKRGIRHAYDNNFDKTTIDIDEAYALMESMDQSYQETKISKQDRISIFEWSGTCRHLRYDLTMADNCYSAAAELDPKNAQLLVKRAGVKMDAGDQKTALSLFGEALKLDPSASDALLHRANLYMLQGNTTAAKGDLEECIKSQPDNIIAHLRLATVFMSAQDLKSAEEQLSAAAKLDPSSSEVHSYRGELAFAQGDVSTAREEFQKAIEADPLHPTPYVNAALAVMNSVTATSPPDVPEAMRLFEKAIEVDPQFHTAYVQLGQLRLSTAVNLTQAREVLELYDSGLKACRTKDELKDICSMRILTVAQVDAASALGMETLNMQ